MTVDPIELIKLLTFMWNNMEEDDLEYEFFELADKLDLVSHHPCDIVPHLTEIVRNDSIAIQARWVATKMSIFAIYTFDYENIDKYAETVRFMSTHENPSVRECVVHGINDSGKYEDLRPFVDDPFYAVAETAKGYLEYYESQIKEN